MHDTISTIYNYHTFLMTGHTTLADRMKIRFQEAKSINCTRKTVRVQVAWGGWTATAGGEADRKEDTRGVEGG